MTRAWSWPVASAATVVASLVCSAVAMGVGGTTIASAPTLSPGQRETPGGATGTLWRVPGFVGDELTLRVEPLRFDTADIKYIHVDLFEPSVDDAGLATAASVATLDVLRSGAVEVTLEVPFTGLGTLMLCVRRSGDCRTGLSATVWGFAFTAHVAHRTRLAISAPRRVHAARSVRVEARVRSAAGTPSGTCVIQRIERPLRGGRCSARVRASAISGGRIQARFVPDDGWQPSSATRSIRVRKH